MSRKLSILIVEDDDSLRETLSCALSRAGFGVRAAADGSTALVLWRIESPDVVLVDFKLPDTDGINLCRRLQGRDGRPVAIIITGYPDEAAHSSEDSGIKALLTKPVSIEDLISILDRLLNKWSPPVVEADYAGASPDGRLAP